MRTDTSRASVILALGVFLSSCSHSYGTTPASAPAPSTRPIGASAARAPAAPDVEFMSGMIGHHSQAIVMAKWAPTHGASPSLQIGFSLVQ